MSDSSLGGGPNARRLSQFIRRQLKLPYSDLSLTDKSDRPMALDDHFGLVLALNYGIGPNEPRLFAVDDAGRLILSPTPGNQGALAIMDDPGVSNAIARVHLSADARGTVQALAANTYGLLWNGVTWDRVRTASAINLNTKFGTGVQTVEPQGEWSVNHNPAAGAQATISQAAGGAGVRNIGRRVSFGFSSGAVLAGVSTVVFNLRDGATGAGAILKSWTFDLPAAVIAPFVASLEVSEVGTANTAMTLETAAAVAGLRVFVNLAGYIAV